MATIFNGNSRYATDFQAVVDRAVAIASLPIRQLESQKSTLTAQQTAWNSIDAKFTALSASLANLAKATGASSYAIRSSNEGVLAARLGAQPSEGTYSVEVLSTGARTMVMSDQTLPAVANPYTQNLSAAQAFTLTVDGVEYVLGSGSGSLAGLAAQINQSGAPVVATIINYGTSSNPDYRLSVQSAKLGDVAISLTDGAQVLVSTVAQGFSASYRVNGQPATPIQSDSRSVVIGPGLEIDLKGVGTTEVEISRSGASVADALEELVTSYNAAAEQLDLHRGSSGGALAGQSLVTGLGQVLRKLGAYSHGGTTLADLGLELDQFGRLSFDRATFESVASRDMNGVLSFLNGAGGDGGFVKVATDSIKQLQDSSGGELYSTLSLVKAQIERQDQLIAQNRDRVALLQENLLARMGAADALIASLEQQVTFMNGMFEAMRSRD